MFLYRFFFAPIAALIIVAMMIVYRPVMEPIMTGFAGVFLLLMLVCSVMTVKHIRGLKVALRQQPEPCSLVVKSIPATKGPPSLILAMTLGGETWRANLAGRKFDVACVGGPHEGRVWRHPVSKIPYAAEINRTKLGIIPTVVKVKPDSLMEHVIQRVHG